MQLPVTSAAQGPSHRRAALPNKVMLCLTAGASEMKGQRMFSTHPVGAACGPTGAGRAHGPRAIGRRVAQCCRTLAAGWALSWVSGLGGQAHAFALGISYTNVSCYGGSNGTAFVSPSGGASPYTYVWSPSGGTSQFTSGRSPGTYTVTVTDATAASESASAVITQPPALVTTPSQTHPTAGANDGLASVIVSGGGGGSTRTRGLRRAARLRPRQA